MNQRPHRHLDEEDVRVRAGRGKSRPRTKQRPQHEDAQPARVVAVDRGRYTCLVQQEQTQLIITAMTARELGRLRVVVGDEVGLAGALDASGNHLARIVRIFPRRSLLRRSADDTDPVERPLVAGCDQVLIVTSTTDPAPRPGLIDRCLVAAYDAGMTPLLVITKIDLAPADPLLALYGPLQVHTLQVALRPGSTLPVGVDEVRQCLTGHRSVCVGHSGVGKSSLVNAVVPDAHRVTGRVNGVTGRGRHTSSSAIALPLPDDCGWLIDTPGVRSFGIAHVQAATILAAFPELDQLAQHCPRGCTHAAAEPGCALDQADGGVFPRVESLRRLLASKQTLVEG